MTNARKLVSGGMFAVNLLLLVAWFSMWPADLQAQTYPGDNVVYESHTPPTIIAVNSHVFIDASQLTGGDICAQINAALVQLVNHPSAYGGAAVIDARGINPNAVPCSASPWNSGVSVPATILLPAGTIVIPNKWVLPNQTTVIGEGDNIGSGTTIQAKASFPDSDMIDFGSSNICPPSPPPGICNNVSLEHLTLDGQGKTINGIVNSNAQTGSHIDHVSLFRILGTGLQVTGNAQNSGPYTNITFDTGGLPAESSTVCAQINVPSGTRGIHGLRCTSTADSQTAILLDSSNNSIADVRIVGFYDGILVGANANAQSNVLINIMGDTTGTSLSPVHVVHISNKTTVTDLSIMGVNNVLGNPAGNEYSIEDDVTSTTLGDTYVAMYILGRPAVGASGYSRFTTSPNAATWVTGTAAPTGSSCTANAGGSLFSNSGTGKALYFCPVGGGSWTGIM
jgi:hypothetical protein